MLCQLTRFAAVLRSGARGFKVTMMKAAILATVLLASIIAVESAEVEDGADPASALASTG